MRSLILLIFLHRLEVPLNRLFIILLQLIVHSNVVETACVLRSHRCAASVPFYRIVVLLLCATVDYTDFVESTGVFRMSFEDLL
jgi:hypothetical protein